MPSDAHAALWLNDLENSTASDGDGLTAADRTIDATEAVPVPLETASEPPIRVFKALLRIDLQNDFLPGGALAVTDGDKIIPIINALSASGYYDTVVDTQDDHPADHGSFISSAQRSRTIRNNNAQWCGANCLA